MSAPARRLLVIDSAYTYRIMKERQVEVLVTSKDLGGYFEHVWTCHPLASLLEPAGSPDRFGRPVVRELAPRHTHIEGKFGRFAWLSWFAPLNLLIAQAGLLFLLLRIVRRERIDLVRAEDPFFNGVMGWIIARMSRLPLMIGVWGNPGAVRRQSGSPMMPRLFPTIAAEEVVERFVLRRADRVLVQNENNREYVMSAGVPREKTRFFRLGNQLHRAHFTDPSQRPGGAAELERLGLRDHPTVLVIARLHRTKLVDHVARAATILKDRGKPVDVLFAGEGPFAPELERLVSELGIADHVRLCGSREQSWLTSVIPAVSMVVSPSTGMALAEAALGGAPVVAYDIDWHSELIEPDVTGELVPYLDVSAMADAMEQLLDDPERARRMGSALRSKALDMLDPERLRRAQIAAYEELLDSR